MAQGQISENNIRISIVIPKDLKLKADQVANADGRSLSGWIRKLITDAVNESNIINKPPNFDPYSREPASYEAEKICQNLVNGNTQ